MVPLRLARGWHCRRANIWGETANSESKGVEYCPCAWAEGQSKPIHPGRHFSNTLGRWERNMKVFPKVPSSSRKLSWKIVQKHPICKGKGWGESLRIKGTETLDKRLRKKKKRWRSQSWFPMVALETKTSWGWEKEETSFICVEFGLLFLMYLGFPCSEASFF